MESQINFESKDKSIQDQFQSQGETQEDSQSQIVTEKTQFDENLNKIQLQNQLRNKTTKTNLKDKNKKDALKAITKHKDKTKIVTNAIKFLSNGIFEPNIFKNFDQVLFDEKSMNIVIFYIFEFFFIIR